MEIYKVFTVKGEPVYYINIFYYTNVFKWLKPLNHLQRKFLQDYIKLYNSYIVLAMRWLFTTYNVISRNVSVKKWLVTTCNGKKCFVTVTKCEITLLSAINRYKSLHIFLDSHILLGSHLIYDRIRYKLLLFTACKKL